MEEKNSGLKLNEQDLDCVSGGVNVNEEPGITKGNQNPDGKWKIRGGLKAVRKTKKGQLKTSCKAEEKERALYKGCEKNVPKVKPKSKVLT